MYPAVESRLTELFGSGFKFRSTERILASAEKLYTRDDVSPRDLFWAYEWLLDARDSKDTRLGIATQLNRKFNEVNSKDKAVGALVLMSEGNPAYRKRNEGEDLIPHLCRPLQEAVVRQRVYSTERPRNACDGILDVRALEQEVNWAIKQRLGGKPKIKN
ncbi:MAG: hypothetical protein PHG85_06040 [Candidatus Altiarchaeota archaeon]|nr:hypothetical protein [Candidatus Altiarchaeota archaeon]